MSIRERKFLLVPKYINTFTYDVISIFENMRAFVNKYLLRGIKSRPVEFIFKRNFYARFQYMHASLSRAGFRFPEEVFSTLFPSLSLCPSFPSKNLPG